MNKPVALQDSMSDIGHAEDLQIFLFIEMYRVLAIVIVSQRLFLKLRFGTI